MAVSRGNYSEFLKKEIERLKSTDVGTVQSEIDRLKGKNNEKRSKLTIR